MSSPKDPFQPVIKAISAVLATPNTPYDTGAATSPDPPLAATVTGLMNVLYSASADMKSVGGAMATGLADVASVLHALADQVAIDPSDDPALQNAYDKALGEFVPPAVASSVQASGQSLSSQVQDLLAATNPSEELYQLAQQLKLIAQQIQPQ
jgi:hypothetical protein